MPKKGANVVHVDNPKVKALSNAKVTTLNAFISAHDGDPLWEAIVSKLVQLLSSEVHQQLIDAMVDALGLKPGDSLAESCEFVLAALKKEFTTADVIMGASLRAISQDSSSIGNHAAVLSQLKAAISYDVGGALVYCTCQDVLHQGPFCHQCGKKPAPAGHVTQMQNAYEGTTCQCGKQNPASACFCSQCATPITRPCSKCQAPLASGSVFCSQCATAVALPASGAYSSASVPAHVASVPPAPSSLVAAEIQHLEQRLSTLRSSPSMGGGPAVPILPSTYAYPGAGEAKGKESVKFPTYCWDERLRQLVDKDNPREHLSLPAFYKPMPSLCDHKWKSGPGQPLHEMEGLRASILQRILGKLITAIGQKEACTYPKAGVGQSTPWPELTEFQQACCLLQNQLLLLAYKEQGAVQEDVKVHLGIADSPIPLEDLKEVSKLTAARQKIVQHLQPTSSPSPRAPQLPNPKVNPKKSTITCFYCGKVGHRQVDCFKRKQEQADPVATKKADTLATQRRLAQMEAARTGSGEEKGQGNL